MTPALDEENNLLISGNKKCRKSKIFFRCFLLEFVLLSGAVVCYSFFSLPVMCTNKNVMKLICEKTVENSTKNATKKQNFPFLYNL